MLVTAPRAEAARMGLVVSAASPPQGEGDDWVRGLTYQPETCGGYTTVGACTNADRGAVIREVPTPVDYVPWAVEASDACTTMGGEADEARLRRRLDQRTSYALARELWLGEQAAADASPNLAFVKPTSAAAPMTILAAGAALNMRRAIGELEAGLAGCLHGQRGMIHVPSLAGSAVGGFVERTGQLLTTKVGDHLVVVDAGYPTGAGSQPNGQTDPAAGRVWLFATPVVVVRRGPVVIEGATDAAAVNISTNLRSRRAWRPVAATHDPCCRLAVQVDLAAG